MNIEVFKTNVEDRTEAGRILNAIHRVHKSYVANFDLQDCDRVLRIVSLNGPVPADELIDFLSRNGNKAEILPDS